MAAAKSASRAVVVVSDDTESEATDRAGLELPSAQNELIEAVAAANPHTVVAIEAGARVVMPWLGKIAAALDAWYPGQTSGTSLADVLFARADPSGHLPVTFPASLGQVPARSQVRFPGVNGKVLYSEGLDVGYRWYDAKNIRPLFPFGFGLSYTHFAFSDLRVRTPVVNGVQDVTVSARITNVGRRAGADVAQLYIGDPPAAHEPPRQLADFRRLTLAPGHSTLLKFTITPRDSWWWDQRAGSWSQTTGAYGVYVGDSSSLSNLPLRGTVTIATTPAARRVLIHAPTTVHPGQPSSVDVWLTAGGNETLHNVCVSLQLPEGWIASPVRRSLFATVSPADAPEATFIVTPPSWAPASDAVIHATARLSGKQE